MKVIAFAATSSKNSINKKLVSFATSLLEGHEVEILDLNDFELPLFSLDREAELGKPSLAQAFVDKIAGCDGLIISFAEHNGCYSAAYKNLFDWCSRINPKVYQDKPMVLFSTSPGAGGGTSVLELACSQMPFFKGHVKASLSVPSFHDNFDTEKGVLTNIEIAQQVKSAVQALF